MYVTALRNYKLPI